MPYVQYIPGLELRFIEDSGANFTCLKGPASSVTNVVLRLPATAGVAGDLLGTTGDGVLAFVAPGGSVLGTVNTWTAENTFQDTVTIGTLICLLRTGTNGTGAENIPLAVWKTDGKTIGDGNIMSWQAKNSIDEDLSYAQIKMEIVDPTDGSEDGKLTFKVVRAGTIQNAMIIYSTGYVETSLQRFGTGSPEGAVSAPVGAFYSRLDGGAGTSFYVKESGSGSTGWVAK